MDDDHTVVHSIPEEYSRMAEAKCECGGTGFELQRQYLMQTPSGPRDVLVGTCPLCHATRWFWFDISSFFKGGNDRGKGADVRWDLPGKRADK